MFKQIRSWQVKTGEEEEKTIRQLEYRMMDFYGPYMLIVETIPKDGMKTIEGVADTYKFENSSVAIGVNETMIAAAREYYYLNNKEPFYVKTKFGLFAVDSENVQRSFEAFQKSIILF